MKPTEARAPRLLWVLLLGACAGGGDTGATGGGDGGDAGDGGGSAAVPPDDDGTVHLLDANNYAFTGLLDGPSFPLRSLQDATLSWADLQQDLQCHDLDPVLDVDNAALLVFPRLTEEEVEDGLSNNTLAQVDLGVYLSYAPGDETEASLSQMTFFGTDADIEDEFAEGSGTWLLLLTTGTTVGVGARMLAFLDPQDDATDSRASVSDGCAVLDVTVDLQAMTPLGVRPDGPWPVVWDGLTTTGQGNPFEAGDVDTLMLARFDALGLAELEGQFLDLELLADGLWTMEHAGGTSADLSALVDASGAAFGGFSAGATYVLALRCSTCPSPAPLFLGSLEPVEG
jgi:hypothetical protein